jgi:hypothetical protein
MPHTTFIDAFLLTDWFVDQAALNTVGCRMKQIKRRQNLTASLSSICNSVLLFLHLLEL